ncbi:M14 family zinc carboxypeptidase [Cesiribacter andamanensis]|nr:M14 family zinc carboxypeptidase [Cesiribacter andamanensis]
MIVHLIISLVTAFMILTNPPAEPTGTLHQRLYKQHGTFKESRIQDRRFKHSVLEGILKDLDKHPLFAVEQVGQSVQKKPIYLVRFGQGPTTVLLWSQMHGDEPTATAALADVFNFFQQSGDGYDSLRQAVLQHTTVYVLPMLNPDGAERYQRYNAQGIDLNRDALRLQAPESQLLKRMRDSLQADWGFNLHDQNIRYAAGPEGPPASISLLAPPIDAAGTADSIRLPAMQLVVELNRVLQEFIPKGVGKWKDEFEPRAFGENMQRWGTRTVLIESGGYHNDPERQQVRRLNFLAILAGLQSIATGQYQQEDIAYYEQIPENAQYLYDVVIRNAELALGEFSYTADIAINQQEKELPSGKEPFYFESSIEGIGDMSPYRGYVELDAKGMQLRQGRIYEPSFANLKALEKANIQNLLKQGYTSVVVEALPENLDHTSLPINIRSKPATTPLAVGEPADFVLEKGGKVRYAVINGFLYDLEKGKNTVKNARIRR